VPSPLPPAQSRYWIDGELVDAAQAALPLTDLGATRGYAAFEALRTYGKVPFLLEEHLERLERSCEQMFLQLPVPKAEIARIVEATLGANSFPESLIRIFVTAGDASGFVPEGRERLLVLVDVLRAYPAEQYTRGISLATTKLGRTLPLVKSTSYLAGIRETIRARREGFDEVVFVDDDGSILEGTTFNVVTIHGNMLTVPEAGVLQGVTIGHVVQLAAQSGLKVVRAPITRKMIAEADEVFITSSTRELLPINRVDGTPIRDGRPGPVTQRLHEVYRQSTARAGVPAGK
jgi:branched-chain amino acid aminotransferase